MRIFLAATEDLYRVKPWRRVQLQLRNVLLSFNGRPNRLVRAYGAAGPAQRFCVDSGAHFFLSEWYKHERKRTVAEAEKFQGDLLTELATLPANARAEFLVELDLQDLYGASAIAAWRRDIWKPASARFQAPICYVWHTADPEADWYTLLDDPDVRCLGVGGPLAPTRNSKGFPASRMKTMVLDAYRVGKAVHGFAKVKAKLLAEIPFTTVDSTSWASGVLFGSYTTFDPRLGKLVRHDVGRNAQKRDAHAVLGALAAHAGGRLRAEDLRASGVETKATTIAAQYTETARAYEAWEDYLTAWWQSRGVDWATRLGAGAPARQAVS